MSEENKEVSVDTSVDTSVESASPEVEADAKGQESEAESTPATESKDGFGKRIKELTDKVRTGKQASDAQIFELRQENERLQGELKDRPKTQEPLKTLEDFEFDETKFNTYKDDRTAKIAGDAASEAVGKVQTQIESGQVEQKFRTKEAEFESTVDDYADVVYGEVNGQRRWQASPEMADEIRLSDMGPEISYHLAKNPEKAAELSILSPRETVRQMTLLEAELKSEKAKTGKSVSDAPPPVPGIPAGNEALNKGYYEGMPDSEFNKLRRKEIANS